MFWREPLQYFEVKSAMSLAEKLAAVHKQLLVSSPAVLGHGSAKQKACFSTALETVRQLAFGVARTGSAAFSFLCVAKMQEFPRKRFDPEDDLNGRLQPVRKGRPGAPSYSLQQLFQYMQVQPGLRKPRFN